MADDIMTDEQSELVNLEWGLWTAVVLILAMILVKGPAVSPEQFVFRIIISVVAVVGALSCRIAAIVRHRRSRRE